MAVQTVIRMGHPRLRELAKPYPIDQIGSTAFSELILDMRETLAAYGGIGLAAPQIDVGYQIAVIEIVNTQSRYGTIEPLPFTVFVNPTISIVDPAEAGYWEGCLSVPGLMGYVERPQHIRVDYLDHQGTPQHFEPTGFLATVFQHEFDHLEGKLYIDRMQDTTRLSFEDEYRQFELNEGTTE